MPVIVLSCTKAVAVAATAFEETGARHKAAAAANNTEMNESKRGDILVFSEKQTRQIAMANGQRDTFLVIKQLLKVRVGIVECRDGAHILLVLVSQFDQMHLPLLD